MKKSQTVLLVFACIAAFSFQSCHILRGKNKCDDCPHWSKAAAPDSAALEAKNTFAGAPNSITFGR